MVLCRPVALSRSGKGYGHNYGKLPKVSQVDDVVGGVLSDCRGNHLFIYCYVHCLGLSL